MEEILNTVIPFLPGVVFTGIGVSVLWYRKMLRRECIDQTAGVVVDEGYGSGQKRNGYRPIFSYSVQDVDHTLQPSTVYRPKKFSEGQRVTVVYDPSKPQRAYILEEGTTYALEKIFIVVGLAILLAAIYSFVL